jgi:uncharacterized membrane protein
MNKVEFMKFLEKKLKRFDKEDIKETLDFYDEIIMDKMSDENFSEEQVIAGLGDPEEIVRNVASDLVSKNKVTSMKGAAILLGLCASPILLPTAIVVCVLYFVVAILWFSLVIIFGSCSIAGIITSFAALFSSADFANIIFNFGGGLFVFGIMAMLTIIVVKYGWKLLNEITVGFANKIKRGSKK